MAHANARVQSIVLGQGHGITLTVAISGIFRVHERPISGSVFIDAVDDAAAARASC